MADADEGTNYRLLPKRRLREDADVRRNALLSHVRTAKSHAALDRLRALQAYAGSLYPFVYVALPSEVQTLPLIDERLSEHLTVVVPCVQGDDLGLYEIDAVNDLSPGVWGILEPDGRLARPARLGEIDLAVIPGVVFDPAGGRLGYGKAYYDHLLARLDPLVVKVGLAFEVQLVRAIPAEPHDVHMDFVITEERTIDCAAVRAAGA